MPDVSAVRLLSVHKPAEGKATVMHSPLFKLSGHSCYYRFVKDFMKPFLGVPALLGFNIYNVVNLQLMIKMIWMTVT